MDGYALSWFMRREGVTILTTQVVFSTDEKLAVLAGVWTFVVIVDIRGDVPFTTFVRCGSSEIGTFPIVDHASASYYLSTYGVAYRRHRVIIASRLYGTFYF